MHSVANLATLQTPKAPKPYLVSENRRYCQRERKVLLSRRTHTSLSLSLSAPAGFSAWQLRCSALSQTIYYVASLILHAIKAEITAQLLPLCYVYLISSDEGSIIGYSTP